MATEHLEPYKWKKGQTGNPKGGSRRTRLTTALLKMIDEKGLDDPFVQVGLREALGGDFKFWAYIFDRVDGKQGGEDGDDGAEAGVEGITIPLKDNRYAKRTRRRSSKKSD